MMRAIAIPSVQVAPSSAEEASSSAAGAAAAVSTSTSTTTSRKRTAAPRRQPPPQQPPPPSHTATATTTGKKAVNKWRRGASFSSSPRANPFWKLLRALLVVSIVTALARYNWNRSPFRGSPRREADKNEMLRTRGSDRDRVDPCAFRTYPPHRYYHLDDRTPEFLSGRDAEYVYGEWPAPLRPPTPPRSSWPRKLCVDQSAWLPPASRTARSSYPFADGTNPSLLSVERIARRNSDLSPDTARFVESLQTKEDRVQYVATICMTNSQCVWGTPVPAAFSNETTPNAVLTALLLLDENFRTLHQATIVLRRDGPWGRMPMPPPPTTTKSRSTANGEEPAAATTDGVVYHTPALDDARLFVHSGQIWVSYREGKGFGYETQVLNPIHVSWTTTSPQKLRAEIWASETTSFCCGRNMALMESRNSTEQLLSLTWVDPVTVVAVDTTPHVESLQKKNRKGPPQMQQRKLQQGGNDKPRKSHVHGTNAFMVPMPGTTDELLGMAHFHRPHDRKPNKYAKFGHHYTHALFTVSSSPPHTLRRLSAEFVLPQAAAPPPPAARDAWDAEIIQFASGLEIVDDDRIVIAYGINDCEAAVTELPLKYAMTELLRPVKPGTQVVDVMRPLKGG